MNQPFPLLAGTAVLQVPGAEAALGNYESETTPNMDDADAELSTLIDSGWVFREQKLLEGRLPRVIYL